MGTKFASDLTTSAPWFESSTLGGTGLEPVDPQLVEVLDQPTPFARIVAAIGASNGEKSCGSSQVSEIQSSRSGLPNRLSLTGRTDSHATMPSVPATPNEDSLLSV